MLLSLLSEQIVTSEKQIVEIQLNRNLRSEIKVAVKCHFDLPVVVDVPKNLDDGTPFPTMFWLHAQCILKKLALWSLMEWSKSWITNLIAIGSLENCGQRDKKVMKKKEIESIKM